ncbi:MAG: C_GCAxxG_C_C family protein [Clostridium butyricum]|nr:C_GCAxxG_C_C family protein [Clostridium butyricum]
MSLFIKLLNCRSHIIFLSNVKGLIKMNKSEQAMYYFENGCNCSQAVLMAYAEELNIEKDIVQKVAVTFGGGMSKAGKTCGCLSGALMVLGLKYGEKSAEILSQRISAYNQGGKFIKLFNEEFGATECKELIKLDLNKKDDMEKAQKEVFGNRCKRMVSKTVELLEENFMKDL